MDCRVKPGNDEGGWGTGAHHTHVTWDHLSFVTPGLDPGVHEAVPYGMAGWVYILSSKPRGTLYVGVTNDLVRRCHEHREGLAEGFTRSHGLKCLVYFERHETVPLAIQREKNLKHWSRQWKLDLVEGLNPQWRDLWPDIVR